MNLQPGIYPSLDFADYLAIEAANASSLKKARKSIAHMQVPRKSSDAFDIGSSVHSLILEGSDAFRERTAIWPKTFTTKTGKTSTSRNCTEAKEWRERMESDGLVIIDRSQAELVAQIARNVSECSAARALLERATPAHECRELTYVWHDDVHDVPCKARADAVAGSVIVDLKTCRSAHPDDFARDAGRYGYHLQAAHYVEGYRALEGHRPDYYVIIAVETEEPYGCAVYDITDEWLWAGERARDEAMEVWADWHHAGRPETKPYPDHITALEPPRWL